MMVSSRRTHLCTGTAGVRLLHPPISHQRRTWSTSSSSRTRPLEHLDLVCATRQNHVRSSLHCLSICLLHTFVCLSICLTLFINGSVEGCVSIVCVGRIGCGVLCLDGRMWQRVGTCRSGR